MVLWKSICPSSWSVENNKGAIIHFDLALYEDECIVVESVTKPTLRLWDSVEAQWEIHPVTSGVKLAQHFIKRSSYQQSHMVVIVQWSNDALQKQSENFCSGLVKILTWIQVGCCGMSLKRRIVLENLPVWINYNSWRVGKVMGKTQLL